MRLCAAEVSLDAFFAKRLDAFVAAEQVATFAAPATMLVIALFVFNPSATIVKFVARRALNHI